MTDRDRTYNGWTNYETWRVHLELFDGYDSDGHRVTGDELKEQADDYVCETSREGIARDYARAFLDAVDWREIAQHVNEYNDVSDDDDDDVDGDDGKLHLE